MVGDILGTLFLVALAASLVVGVLWFAFVVGAFLVSAILYPFRKRARVRDTQDARDEEEG